MIGWENPYLKKLEFNLYPGEFITLLAVNKENQLLVFSNIGRVWISTNAPIEYLDMVDITPEGVTQGGINAG